MDVETVEMPNGPKDAFSERLYLGQELQVRARVCGVAAMVLLTSIDVCYVIAGGFARAVLRL